MSLLVHDYAGLAILSHTLIIRPYPSPAIGRKDNLVLNKKRPPRGGLYILLV